MILLGSKVFDKSGQEFTVGKSLGNGGFGQVFQISNGADSYALKVAHADGISEGEYQSLLNEGKSAILIDHENVIKLHYFHDGKTHAGLPPYLILSLANGGSLREFIEARKKDTRQLTEDELIPLVVQIMHGMKAVNEKLVHRDLHPGNILFSDGKVKVTDFGLSKLADAVTRTNTFKGTQHIFYKAPESWKMQANTIQMDMYSVGLVLFELATLRYPFVLAGKKDVFVEIQEAHFFGSPTPFEIVGSSKAKVLKEIILRLIKKKPSDRFNTWDDALNLLNADSSGVGAAVDVASMVAKSRAADQAREAAKLAEEQRHLEAADKRQQLRFAIATLEEDINTLVSSFNSQTQTASLIFNNMGNGFSVSANQGKTIKGEFFVTPDIVLQERDPFGRGTFQRSDRLKLHGKEIDFWGYMKTSSGIGVNLALMRDAPDDLYGTWRVLTHRWNALNSRRDGRPEPFPLTDWSEFSRQIQIIQALGLIDTRVGHYSLADIKFLFEDII